MIRPMSPADVEFCISMGHEMHEESYFHFLDYSDDKLRRLWTLIKDYPDQYCAFTAEKDDKIIGFFIGTCQEHWFGHDRVACDLALFITKEERGGSAAPRLIKAYERWAEDVGAKEIHIGTSTNVNLERVTALFKKMGYGDEAFYFRKRI